DNGMYDAVNRGIRRSTGDIVGYINCDEQYLPGALKAVHDFFADHPKVDVVLADTLIVDGQGNYICHRHALVPIAFHIWIRFSFETSSLFMRRRVFDEMGIYFDT